jgi:ankyrin repeat protein
MMETGPAVAASLYNAPRRHGADRECAMERSTSELAIIHEAHSVGDLEALKAALGNPADFPNSRPPLGAGDHCLEYAIYHGPLSFVRSLLELGADPNYESPGGFPIAALATDRADRIDILRLLLAFGANVGQRGVNDGTPLHYAVAKNDLPAIELLRRPRGCFSAERALGAVRAGAKAPVTAGRSADSVESIFR